jgi:UDP-N-acetylglucosamine acyltransferase
MKNSFSIHPTAIIHNKSKISKNVHVGAYSVVDENVEIGEGTIIGNFVTLTGRTVLGKHNKIFHSSSIGEDPQDMKYKDDDSYLRIGDGNVIREFCTINKGTIQDKNKTIIGNNNWIMAYCHIAHDCIIGNNIVMANSTTLGGHVEVSDFAVLGGGTLIHQFCKIGAHVMTAGGSGILNDVPPYLIVHGNIAKPVGINFEGLKRRGFSIKQLSLLKKGYKIIYRENNTLSDAIEKLSVLSLEDDSISLFIEFLKNSKRGIVR